MPVTAGDGTDAITCCAVIGPYEDLSVPRRTCPVSKERHHPLLNPHAPTLLQYQSVSTRMVIVSMECVTGSAKLPHELSG